MLEAIKNVWKNIKKSVARSILKKYVTRENIADVAASAVNKLILDKVTLDEAKVAKVTTTCARAALLAAEISEATKDKTVTKDECFSIGTKVSELTGVVLDDATLDNLIEKIVEKL